jgi:hypothetical protein
MRALVVNNGVADALSARLGEALRGRVDPQGPAVASYEEAEGRLLQL